MYWCLVKKNCFHDIDFEHGKHVYITEKIKQNKDNYKSIFYGFPYILRKDIERWSNILLKYKWKLLINRTEN